MISSVSCQLLNENIIYDKKICFIVKAHCLYRLKIRGIAKTVLKYNVLFISYFLYKLSHWITVIAHRHFNIHCKREKNFIDKY